MHQGILFNFSGKDFIKAVTTDLETLVAAFPLARQVLGYLK